MERTVEVAAAKMDPTGLLDTGGTHGVHVVTGKLDTHLGKLLGIVLPMFE